MSNEEKLIYLAHSGNGIEELKTLLQKHVDINFKDPSGYTALHYYSIRGEYESIKLLIENGADMNIKDNYGRIPFHYYYNKKEKKIYDMLYETYSNYDIKRNIKG